MTMGFSALPKDHSITLQFGPLTYGFVGHDEWGRLAVSFMDGLLGRGKIPGPPSLTFHLAVRRLTAEENEGFASGCLPDTLAELLPKGYGRKGWKAHSDEYGGCIWRRPDAAHAVWTRMDCPVENQPRLWLPWGPLAEDLLHTRGGLLHAGLAMFQGDAYLFLAPPSGGKTTTMARLPAPWQVLGDDAALIWPDGAGGFLTSPLPTWGQLLRREEPRPYPGTWEIGKAVKVAAMVVLRKGRRVKLSPLSPISTARAVYLGLSEHPGLQHLRDLLRIEIFRAACRLARAPACWELQLSKKGDIDHAMDTLSRGR
jgi:hypothetical protein